MDATLLARVAGPAPAAAQEFPIVLFALILGTLATLATPAPVRTGAPPPLTFDVPVAGARANLSTYRGSVVVIDLMATWCAPCRKELPLFQRAAQRFGGSVHVIGVSNEPHDVAASYYRLWNVDLPVVEDLDGSIFRAYGAPPIPVTVILDPQGNVSFYSVGELSWTQLRDAIERAQGVSAPSKKRLR